MLPVFVAAAVLVAVAAALSMARKPTLYQRLAATAPERAILPRTSLEGPYRECQVERSDSAIPNVACARARVAGGESLERIAAAAQRQLDERPNADAFRTRALLEMHSRPAVAITLLEQALPLSPDSAGVMVDLAAAHLTLAGQEQTMENLLTALDWSMWALEVKPDHPQALFNRAVALELLTADMAARDAWNAYLAATAATASDTLWNREARLRLRALGEKRVVPTPALYANDAELTRFAHAYPQDASDLGWRKLLPLWTDTLLAGDTAVAAGLLHRAEVLGTALFERTGDASLHDHVSAIRSNRGGMRNAALAEQLDFQAKKAQSEFRPGQADSLLNRLTAYSISPADEARLLVRRAAIKLDQRDTAAAERVLQAAARELDAARYPSSAARADWYRGTLLADKGRYSESVAAYRRAEAAYARVGGARFRATVQYYLSDAERQAGDPAAANTWLHRAATGLRPFGSSAVRGYTMKGMAEAALNLDLPRAMRALADEMVAINAEGKDSVYQAEARFTRAALLAAAGGNDAALKELEAIGPIDAFEDGAVRDFMAASTAYVRALAKLEAAPDSVIEMVKVLIRYEGQEIWPTRGFALSAQARLATGDTAGAERDLNRVFMALDHGRDAKGGAAIRDLVEGDVRPAMLRLVETLARTDPLRALQYAERGSAALSSVKVGDTRLPSRIPPGRVVVRPLVLDSTLLIWTFMESRISLTRTRIRPAALYATVDSADTALLRDRGYEPYLSRLYQMLIQPVEHHLRGADELVFVHDAQLGGVPLVALLDAAGQPLVRKYTVWRAVTVAAGAAPHAAPPDSGAFVAPAFDQGENTTLEPLPHARAEVDGVSRHYPHRRLTVDSASTPTALRDALSHYPLIHFAGHAVVNNMRPERSYLLLAPEPGAPTGHLAAEQLEELDLRHVRLVVLSACATLGGDEGSVGFTGLSGALLGAGARGVVGSLWTVNDKTTGRLMNIFHAEYRLRRNPVRALREAQLQMLDSSDPVESSPRAWAAFQYVGR